MSALNWSTVIDHTTDAGFHAWASEISTKLQACGLVQTADTGQINLTTVLRPASNASGGYQIYYNPDSLSSGYPMYIKIEYGTGSSSSVPNGWITVGTGSNGSGTITGLQTVRTTFFNSAGLVSTSTVYQSYCCVTEGFVGLAFKLGAQSSGGKGLAFFCLSRSCNDSGAITGDWMCLYTMQPGSSAQCRVEVMELPLSSTVVFTDGSACCIHGNQTSSMVGLDVQLFKHFVPTPRIRPIFTLLSIFQSEASIGTTFTASPVAAANHTYVCLGGAGTNYFTINQPANTQLCMIYE